jgi:hypothetical protein
VALVSFIASENINQGDVVTINPSGLLYKASASEDRNARVVGIATNAGQANELIFVNKDSYSASSSGLTPGSPVYLSVVSGSLNNSYTAWLDEVFSTPLTNAYVTTVGRAVTSSGVSVEVAKPVSIDITGGYLLLEGGFFPGFILAEDGATIELEN